MRSICVCDDHIFAVCEYLDGQVLFIELGVIGVFTNILVYMICYMVTNILMCII